MSLSKVTLICDLADGQGNYLTQGTGYFAPTAVLTDSTDHLVAGTQPAIPVAFHAGAGPPQVELIACDNAGILPAPGGWAWTFTPPSVTGIAPFSFFLDYADGATQYLSGQIPVSAPSGLQAWMPLPAGTPAAGQVPEATGVGQASAWGSGGGGGAVASVNGQTGVVVLTAADVDADASGAATTAQAAAEAASIPAGTIISGQFLAAPKVYAPAAQTLLSVTTTTMAAWDSGVVCTGSFTAPPSGEVLVTAWFVLMVAAAGWVAVGLAATGTVTPVIGNLVQIEVNAATSRMPVDVSIPVTGLTPGTAYNLDLLGAVSAAANPASIEAFGVSTTTPGLAGTSVGAPVVITVQGV